MYSIYSYWNLDYIIIVFLALLCFVYLYTVRFHLTSRSIYFFAAIVLLVGCTLSPLHFLAENYLFSVHMLTHTIILLVAAPLLIAAIPVKNTFAENFISLSKKIGNAPLACWLAGVSVMWFWHIPSVFNRLFMNNAMMMSSPHTMNLLSYLHMLSLLVAGMIFCFPLINPLARYRMSSLKAVLYLTSACVMCSLLGLLITFAPGGTYTHYIGTEDMYGFLPTVRSTWGISAATDQQMGGLIMWVPCCFIYLMASMYILITWFDEKRAAPLVKTLNR